MSLGELDELCLDGKTANKGEWAELYVFLRLLGEGRLYTADQQLLKNPKCYVEVLRILREEISGEISEYARNDAEVELVFKGETLCRVNAELFLEQANGFYEYLLHAEPIVIDGQKRGVLVSDEVAQFSHLIKISKYKSPSSRSLQNFGGKTDIIVMIRDTRSALVSTMGFSIKSQWSQPPTLYNAGPSTGFEYELIGVNDDGMELFNHPERINPRSKWFAAALYYKEQGWTANFLGTTQQTTWNNLFLIRDSMPLLMAWINKRALLEDYHGCGTRLVDLVKTLEDENPMEYPSTKVYEKAIKDLLFASFSGMTQARPWDGTEQVNGGYIVVKPDGDVLCYHTSDRERFREYLFTQTKIEYVGRTHYNWGRIRKTSDGRYLLKLNSSIRFYKTFQPLSRR